MIINYQAKNRKELAILIGEFYKEKPKYLGVPTCAYKICDVLITKEGNLNIGSKDKSDLIEYLESKGYSNRKIITVHSSKACSINLERILTFKGDLIKKALGVDNLNFKGEDGYLIFPWFKEIDEEHLQVYTLFIERLCELSKKQKWVNKTYTKIVNEKYTFRCFLLRLGFIGEEYKKARKILLENLNGSSAFRFKIDKGIVKVLREIYPEGTRIKLIKMEDIQAPATGTLGTVKGVDDACNILVDWDNGSSLSVIYDVDIIEKI